MSAVTDKHDKRRKSSKALLTLDDFKTSDNAIDSEHYKRIKYNI